MTHCRVQQADGCESCRDWNRVSLLGSRLWPTLDPKSTWSSRSASGRSRGNRRDRNAFYKSLEPNKGLLGTLDDIAELLLGPLPLAMRKLGSQSIPADDFANEVEQLNHICEHCWVRGK
jgi:hypothetical protein